MLLTQLGQELSSPAPQVVATTFLHEPGLIGKLTWRLEQEQMKVSLLVQEEVEPSPFLTVRCQCLPFGLGRTSTLLASVISPVWVLPSKGSPCGKRGGRREEP